jgi:F-type H+-transporting ATPase subunit alpha
MNAGQSVSRVGGAAQIAAMKSVSGTLRLELAQYRELAAFSQFGSDLDEATQRTLRRGKILVEVLKQPQYAPLDVALQVSILYAATKGFLDKYDVSRVRAFESAYSTIYKRHSQMFWKKYVVAQNFLVISKQNFVRQSLTLIRGLVHNG